MSDGEARPLRDHDHVRAVVAEACFRPARPVATPGRVGLEVEAFAFEVPADGAPPRRLPLAGLLQLLDDACGVPPIRGRRPPAGGVPVFELDSGGTLSFEPGAQLELSTAPHPTVTAALAEARAVPERLAGLLQQRGGALACAGMDPLAQPAVPQQLAAPRYQAMAAYFARRGRHGAAMMRQTGALQINLDLGPAAERAERFVVANLVSPLACATFACSPAAGAMSARARTWQALDPTRTGFPRRLLDGSSDDPVEQLTDAALRADVLLLRRDPPPWEPGRPGWTFAAWLRDGHPRHGRPTADDLRYHLSTLFPEVRARGFLELRAVDALPARYRPVPAVLLAGLLEDARARGEVLAVLERQRPGLEALWRRAATVGLADPALCAMAVETWSLALAGAARLPAGYLPAAELRRAEAFLDRFTLRGACPADELRAARDRGPAAALACTAEPVRVHDTL